MTQRDQDDADVPKSEPQSGPDPSHLEGELQRVRIELVRLQRSLALARAETAYLRRRLQSSADP